MFYELCDFHVVGTRLRKWTNPKINVCFALHFTQLSLTHLLV